MFPGRKIVQIYNPVDTDLFRPAEDRNAIRAGLGIPPGAFVIACGATGLFNPVKGGHFIPWCWRNYTGAGTGTFISCSSATRKKRGLPLPQHKRRIHYGHEQAGRALQRGGHFPEPHASGCPFQRSAGIHGLQNPFRYLPDGRSSGSGSGRKDGAGRSAGDLNQMAAHCERLIQDGKLLQTLAEEGRRHAEQTFSYPVIAARHAALYEETLREYRYEE